MKKNLLLLLLAAGFTISVLAQKGHQHPASITGKNDKQVSHPASTITWTGLANNHDWDDPGNWSPASVPGLTDNVIFPSEIPDPYIYCSSYQIYCNNIDVFSQVDCFDFPIEVYGNMVIHAGGKVATAGAGSYLWIHGTLDINGSLGLDGPGGSWVEGNINVTGNLSAGYDEHLSSSGDLFLSGSMTLLAGGSITVQNADISGNLHFDYFPDRAGGQFRAKGNLLVENSGNVLMESGWYCPYMSIIPPGTMTIDGNLNVLGSLTVGNNASLITHGTITGNPVTISKFFCLTDKIEWHFLSSPIMHQNICNGHFAPYETDFITTSDTLWDFYKWAPGCLPPPTPAEHWKNLRTSTQGVNYADFGTPPSFEVTKGYLVGWGYGFGGGIFTGTPNTGDQVCNFSDITTTCSWELVGNPFPCGVDWDKVLNKENLTSNYYFIWSDYKEGGPGYIFLNTGTISSCQGFFVKVKPTGNKFIIIPDSSKTPNNIWMSWMKNSDPAQDNKLSITFSNGTFYDQAYVMFEPNSETGEDWNDAEKLFSMDARVPQVYTIVNNDLKTAMNSLPYTDNSTIIPIGIVPQSNGNFSIKVTGDESFNQLTELFLEDRLKNTTQNLLLDSVYTFSAEANEDAGRFLLHLSGTIGIENSNKENSINIFSTGKSVIISGNLPFSRSAVTICNLLGQVITTEKFEGLKKYRIDLNVPPGYYFVKIQGETTVTTAKIYIN
jgi:hypothetical protein